MKYFLLLFFALPLFSFAQDTSTVKQRKNYLYAEIIGKGRWLSSKVDVSIDYGQESKYFSHDDNRIMNTASGRPKKFNSMVDAMNFMGKMGWAFVQAYVITEGESSVCHWLMKRELTNSEFETFLATIRQDLRKTTGY